MALELLTRGVGDVVGGSVASGRGVEFLVGVAAAGGGGGAGGSRSLISLFPFMFHELWML